MAKAISLRVSPKVMKDVDDSQSPLLKVPPDAGVKGIPGTDDATYTWPEFVQIVKSDVVWDMKKLDATGEPYVLVFQPTFAVQADSPIPTVNVGRQFTKFYRVNQAAIDAGNAADGQYKMSIMSMGRLKALLRAVGYSNEDIDARDLVSFFKGSAEQPAEVIGAKVFIRMKDYLGKDQDDNPQRQQEPTKFASETSGTI